LKNIAGLHAKVEINSRLPAIFGEQKFGDFWGHPLKGLSKQEKKHPLYQKDSLFD